MDYKLKLMQILEYFGEQEGTWYEDSWFVYGVSNKKRLKIDKNYLTYTNKKTKLTKP